MRPTALPLMVQQHADEAAILFRRRGALLASEEGTLTDLRLLDGELTAHCDGLRLAGAVGWSCVTALFEDDPDPGTMFALAYLSVFKSGEKRTPALFAALEKDPSLIPAAALGLCWHGRAYVTDTATHLLAGPSATHHALALEVSAMIGSYPNGAIAQHLEGPPVSRARALRLAGRGGLAELGPRISKPKPDDDTACAFARACAATQLTAGGVAAPGLFDQALVPGPEGDQALAIAAICLPRDKMTDWFAGLPPGPEVDLRTVQAAGYMADPALVPWLINKSTRTGLFALAEDSVRRLSGTRISQVLTEDGPVKLADPFGAPAKPELSDKERLKVWWDTTAARLGDGPIVLGQPATATNLSALMATALLADREMIQLRLRQVYGVIPSFTCDAPAWFQTA